MFVGEFSLLGEQALADGHLLLLKQPDVSKQERSLFFVLLLADRARCKHGPDGFEEQLLAVE